MLIFQLQVEFFLFAERILKVVWVAGFEPAASEFQARPSTKLTIYPVIFGGRQRSRTPSLLREPSFQG